MLKVMGKKKLQFYAENVFLKRYILYLMLQLNYARYYLPKLFPDLKRIVFIDDDAIVQGKPPYFT